MTIMLPEPQTQSEIDIQWEVEAVLAWHDDDAKAAIATLLEDNRHLRKQLALAEFAGSRGFARGWRPRYER
ncbi:hypothetical protein [Neorhizobium sp. T7_12]|uniref:hypothetical protein n=1 Tax=Neorhizobium sp. T7_12 TaxID=2093832 RepID=UPI001FE0A6A1|nr:hypothetical protein [Neorhizobium sp. T7_12]